MKTLTYSEVRQNLTAAMNETVDDRIPILITRRKALHVYYYHLMNISLWKRPPI